MRLVHLTLAASILLMGLSGQLFAQSLRIGRVRFAAKAGLRVVCAAARAGFGIILGEHRERHEEWRREHPDVFFYER